MKDYKKIIPALAGGAPRCLVLGAGKSGVAAVRVLRAVGAEVVLVDSRPAEKMPQGLDCGLCAACEELPSGAFDLCVVSPAIPAEHTWLRQCAGRGIPVIAEMELGYAFWQGRILAVTGSKGKSSVVKLCAETLTAAGHPAVPCGNYGVPLCDVVMDAPQAEWAIAETSSFQLEHIIRFRPDVAILLNLQADHLDRHGSMEEYARMKFRLFENQTEADAAFLPADFNSCGQPPPRSVAVQTFGVADSATWRYSAGLVTGKFGGEERRIEFAGTWFDNPVLGEAAAAVAGALFASSLTSSEIVSGLRSFRPLPHRMQPLVKKKGVLFVDDSKATSLTATAAAVRMASGGVRLIAGGRLKEKNLSFVKDLLTKKVKKVYLIGECEKSLFTSWNDSVECQMCHDMENAVKAAAAEAVPGDVVLLSPGCASFDQFTSYGQRGEVFARLVESVAGDRAD